MTTSNIALLRAESALGSLAERATEVKTRKAARNCIKHLLIQVEEHRDVLAAFEQTDDVVDIARNALTTVCIDERPAFGVPVDPADAYSQRLEQRSQNLPRALDILESLTNP